MNQNKRKGQGGNSSIDPQHNLIAQQEFKKNNLKNEKKCTGFLHHDGPEIAISQFRQQKSNKKSGLQSRCDVCNRLYFSIIQKPTKRIVAIVIWAEITGEFDWKTSVPAELDMPISNSLKYWLNNPCEIKSCMYDHHHSSYRDTSAFLTKEFKNLDKGPRVSNIYDEKTRKELPAPRFMHEMQKWAGKDGILSKSVDNKEVWDWWVNLFYEDTAYDSAEKNQLLNKAQAHLLKDFSWGAGNILETVQGHSVPGFNKVKAGKSELKNSSSSSSRAYGFLVEGDRKKMMAFSRECKNQGLSLGHSPAPLRWLGKDDPINAKGQPLQENVLLNDSLIDLYEISKVNPESAGQYVSWQIRELVIGLGKKNVSFESFTQKIESEVEKYFDKLEAHLENNELNEVKKDLKRADPGKTESVYEYRLSKISEWLIERPASKRRG